jgi:hypothetical protein
MSAAFAHERTLAAIQAANDVFARRFGNCIGGGMTDLELKEGLHDSLGIFGGLGRCTLRGRARA